MVYGPFIERVRNGKLSMDLIEFNSFVDFGPEKLPSLSRNRPLDPTCLLGALKVHNFTNYVKISC